MHYNYHRYYDPSTGRYLRADPIGLAGTDPNLYGYVSNNPIGYIDPNGLWRIPDYISFSLNVSIPNPVTGTLIGWTGQIEMDRYANIYVSPTGANVGKSLTAVSASGTAGWLNECDTPSEDKMKQFLEGHSFNISGGHVLGGGLTIVPGIGTATEAGIFFMPQGGASYNYSFYAGNLP